MELPVDLTLSESFLVLLLFGSRKLGKENSAKFIYIEFLWEAHPSVSDRNGDG